MLSEGAEVVGESGTVYLAVAALGQANVWAGTARDQPSHIVVIKEPGADDPPPWRSFQNELIMHELFKEASSIRRQVDRIPPTPSGGPPMLVLEMFETTLWTARTKRPFTVAELKSICKAALVGLRDVHDQGLVYADLKMQNVMVDGFNVNNAKNDSELVVKLGDLGIVMPPCIGKVQPVSYRAPEVYFKGEISSKADIWAWGLIYCHLLEARNRFSKTGLYDDLETAHGTIPERESAVKYAISNDYKIHDELYFHDVALPQRNDATEKGDQWEELRARGLADGEVDFLRWVMRADPTKRPSAEQILRCGWLDKTEDDVATGFEVPVNARGRVSIEFDPMRGDDQQERQKIYDAMNGNNNNNKPSFLGGPTTAAPKNLGPDFTQNYQSKSRSNAFVSAGGLAPSASAPVGFATSGHAFGAPVSTTPTRPQPVKTKSTLDEELEEIYRNRTQRKRRSSHSEEIDNSVKKAYTPAAASEGEVQSPDQGHRPVSAALSAADAATATLLGHDRNQPRPAFSTQNTGTFLSYR